MTTSADSTTTPAPVKAVLVTGAGAGSGIGEAAARRPAGLGHRVFLGARRTGRLASPTGEPRAGGASAAHRELDVTSLDPVRAFVAAGFEEYGRIDVLSSRRFPPRPSPTPSPSPWTSRRTWTSTS